MRPVEPALSRIALTTYSLEKLEQKISEVLEELNRSQSHEKVITETMKFDKATFEEATRRLENRVSGLEAELERSREWCVIHLMFSFHVLITPQHYPSEYTFAGAIRNSLHWDIFHTGCSTKQALQDRFDDQTVTLRLTKETNAELQVRLLV